MAYAKLLALPRVVTVPSMRSGSHHVTSGNRFLGQKITKFSKMGSNHIGLKRIKPRDLYHLKLLVLSFILKLVSSVPVDAEPRDRASKMTPPPNFIIFFIQVTKLFLLTWRSINKDRKTIFESKITDPLLVLALFLIFSQKKWWNCKREKVQVSGMVKFH